MLFNVDPVKTFNTEREFNIAGLKSRVNVLIKNTSRNKATSRNINDIAQHYNNIQDKLSHSNILHYLNSINHTIEMNKTLHSLKMLKRSIEKTKSPLPSFTHPPSIRSSQSNTIHHNKQTINNTNQQCYLTRNKIIYDIIPITKIQEKGSCKLLPKVNNITEINSPKGEYINTITNIDYLTIESPQRYNSKSKCKHNRIKSLDFLLEGMDKEKTISFPNQKRTHHGKGKSLYIKNIKNLQYKVKLNKINLFENTLYDNDKKRIAYQRNKVFNSKMLSTDFPRNLYHHNYVYSNNKYNITKEKEKIFHLDKAINKQYNKMKKQVSKEKPHYDTNIHL
jgi:hypothetical protein